MRLQQFIPVLSALIALSAAPSRASVCEPSTETRHSLSRLDLAELPPNQRQAQQLTTLKELLAQHPDDVFLNLRYQQIEGFKSDVNRAIVIEKYKALADAHPGNSDYAFLYATALVGADSPDAIARFKSLAGPPSGYPLANLHLAELYESGKFANKEELRTQLDRFFESCPAALNADALSFLQRIATSTEAATYAPALRARLSKDSGPDVLSYWETVWTLEFKAHPPSEHAQVRKQIAADLAKLEQNPPTTDIERLLVLRAGYKTLSDETALRSVEDRIVSVAPRGEEALLIYYDRWASEHPYPKTADSESIKQSFYRALLAFSDERLKVSPDDSLSLGLRIDALTHLDDSSTKQFVDTVKALQAALRNGPDSLFVPPTEFLIADAYLKRRTHVRDVPGLVAEGWESFRSQPGFNLTADYYPDNHQKYRLENEAYLKTEAARILVDAAQQLKKPAIAKSAMDDLDGVKPEKPKQQSALWAVKAKWAELNNHKLDALLMYRAALDLRPASDKPSGNDELAANVERLRNELGGTPESDKLLASKSAHVEVSTEGDWQAQTKDLPTWRLLDLAGQTWTATSLHGKTVLINIWATWCGPCQQEHPFFQTLYEKIKNRSDIQVLTFDVDEQVGDVAPYMAEHKYTFPVLLAADYVNDVLPELGIPRLWIVDATGKWRWEQVGMSTDDDAKWEKQLLEKLDSVKTQQ
jgi:thiol-disulfide isomerase/thioredoxin